MMTFTQDDRSVLLDIFRKAGGHGWDRTGGHLRILGMLFEPVPQDSDDIGNFVAYMMRESEIEKFITRIIFDHDFAKALWGDEPITHAIAKKSLKPGLVSADDLYGLQNSPAWKFHLQQLVLAEDRILYLKENS